MECVKASGVPFILRKVYKVDTSYHALIFVCLSKVACEGYKVLAKSATREARLILESGPILPFGAIGVNFLAFNCITSFPPGNGPSQNTQ